MPTKARQKAAFFASAFAISLAENAVSERVHHHHLPITEAQRSSKGHQRHPTGDRAKRGLSDIRDTWGVVTEAAFQ